MRVAACLPGTIIGDHLYITSNESYGKNADAAQDYALATDRVSKVEHVVSYGREDVPTSYLDDIRNQPRSLVIGNSWETGTPTPGGNFVPVGTRLVPSGNHGPTSAFDTATRRPIHLHLPAGYQPDHDEPDLEIFEWLDDDTVALVRPTTGMAPDLPYRGTPLDRDILTCRLSTGRCEVAAPSHGHVRVLPGAALW